MENILNAFLQFGIGGLMTAAMLWFLWYRETKTIPALLATFGKEQEADRSFFAAEQEADRRLCRENTELVLQAIADKRHS